MPFLGEPSLSDARSLAAAGDAELAALARARASFRGDLAALARTWDDELADLSARWTAAKNALSSVLARTGIPDTLIPAASEWRALSALRPAIGRLGALLRKLGGIAEFGGAEDAAAALAYRRTWDPYVLAVARVLSAAGDAWEHRAPGISTAILSPAAATSQATYDRIAAIYRSYARDLMASWNQFAGLHPDQIALRAGEILASEQAAVDRIQSFYVPQLRRDAPGLPLPKVPGLEVQKAAAGAIEGAGIAARGAVKLVTDAFFDAPGGFASWATGGLVAPPDPDAPPKPGEIPWGKVAAGAAVLTAGLALLAFSKRELVG